ncbi:MAG: FimB/Mfa2 family fimbrial subunit [Alistipes sp.]|nr:FimB/Mfa2 family fimbrial subunit [Alistipes sp.]
MKHLIKILFTTIIGAAGFACVNQDPDLDDCEQSVMLLFDWIDPATPRDNTSALNVKITGDNADISTTAPVEGKELEIFPGEYRFTAWESATNVTIDGTVLTVASTDGVATEPQDFTAGTTTDRVINNDTYQEIHVPMYQQTRDLIIRLQFTGDGVSLIQSASGSVSGIALSRELTFGFPPVDGRIRPQAITHGSVAYTFTEGADSWWTGQRTLLGNAGDDDQIFTVTVGLDEDQSVTEQVDFTSEFNGFHTVNLGEPWVISIELQISASLDLSIVDWYTGTESWLEAE